MMKKWSAPLNVDPLPALLDWEDDALHFFVNRDLTGKHRVDPIETLWTLPEAEALVRAQLEDGSWKYHGKTHDPLTGTNYFLIETFRNLRVLVDTYGFNRKSSTIETAAEFIFSCQTDEGDIRGIIGNQYMPYYHGTILGLLIKAWFADDVRLTRGLDWLLSMRQDDGGWIVPAQLVPSKDRTSEFWLGSPIHPDRSQPHAHLATGMALRGLAFHPGYCRMPETLAAGSALKSRFFTADKYNDRKAASYWFKFQFPFWWSNCLTVLDTLSRLGFDRQDADISKGLDWFITYQEEDGLWPTSYGSGKKAEPNRRWIGLAICRVLKSYFEGT
jgi:hypothetical protein